MKKQISEALNQGNFIEARTLLNQYLEADMSYDDVIAVLEASICQAEGDGDGMFYAIRKGLKENNKNYELYFLLGFYYCGFNVNQAYLCFENALLYCDNEEDYGAISAQIDELKQNYDITVKPVAIVIVSYNCRMFQIHNIESIRQTLLPGSYSMIVVDNASEDGIVDWLREQEDILLLENSENKGFSVACNQGVEIAKKEGFGDYDIYLLNNDTRLVDNALFWLRMGLYESEDIGATGSYSNYAGNEQEDTHSFESVEEYLAYGRSLNIPLMQPYEERVRLSGFSMLIRGDVWKKAGGMNEAFTPGYFEDDALSMEIQKAGYRLLTCKNSYIYHAGSQSFAKKDNVNELLISHQELFIQLYGFHIFDYAKPNRNVVEQMKQNPNDVFGVLEIGCGLGADLKLLRMQYPCAMLVGIEQKDALYQIAKETEEVYQDIRELAGLYKNPFVDALIVEEADLAAMTSEQRLLLSELCKPNCQFVNKKQPYQDFPFDKIKLIVWDMDDTFWHGTISEEDVIISSEHEKLIRDLVDCGIVNSISSKNDEKPVLDKLEEANLKDLFVFNHINWEPKGRQLVKKLADMNLRPANVLFIDDNKRNLEEAKYQLDGLMTALPDIIPYLAKYVAALEKKDLAHTRHKQYQLLEKKKCEQEQYDSSEAFLKDSAIQVEIVSDCYPMLDRIAELVMRSNQLNYTKNRSSKQELEKLISDDWNKCGYVQVKDRFGEYGLVGFYCFDMRQKKMEHFLFSCRILGMHIEQWVYQQIGSPVFEIVQPVAAELKPYVPIDWINTEVTNSSTPQKRDTRMRILLKGPCDMSAIEAYLIGGRITTEFNYVSEKGVVVAGQNHSVHVIEGATLKKEQIDMLLRDAPFLDRGDFETKLFEKPYHIICFSMLPDGHAGLYRHKQTGQMISFGSVNFDLTDEKNWQGYIDGTLPNHAYPFTREVLEQFRNTWEFVGITPVELLEQNLEYIYTHVPGSPVFIFLLGSEIAYEGDNVEFEHHELQHASINRMMEKFIEKKERVRLIHMGDFIESQADYEDSINHFSRRVYYDLATAVVSVINESF